MKRIICFILCIILLAALCGCAAQQHHTVGSGTPGVVEKLNWGGYEALLKMAQKETDLIKRAEILRKAEAMLLDTGAVIPTSHAVATYMLKPEVTGVYVSPRNTFYYDRIAVDGMDSLRIQISAEVPSLDSAMQSATDCTQVMCNTFAGLFRVDADGQVQPDLVESYTLSDDAMTYTFRLKPNLKWSDGTPCTARDFVYTWKRNAATSTGATNGEMFNVIRGYPDNLEVYSSEDGRTLTVNLNTPCAYFLDLCTFSVFLPLLQKQVENAPGYKDASGKVVNPGAWATEAPIITNGAYTIDKWQHNEYITLKKNPNYHAADEIKTETLDLMLSNDASAIYAAYQSGDVCLIKLIPNDIITELLKDPELHVQPALGTNYLALNVTAKVFAGMTAEEAKTFRKAISCAIDRSFIRDVALGNGAPVALGLIPPYTGVGNGQTYEETVENNENYYSEHADLERAREMLKSIGFEFGKDGKLKSPITLEYLNNSAPTNDALAACIQADLAPLGINVTISSVEWNVFLGERRNGTFDLARGAWILDYNDPYAILSIFTAGSPNNDPRLGK